MPMDHGPLDQPAADGTARRIALIRKTVARGTDPYEQILTRFAAQVLLSEIGRLTGPSVGYVLVDADHVAGTAENISVHRTLAGASAKLRHVASQRGMDLHEPGAMFAPADRPSATGGNGLTRSQGLCIEDIELED